MLLLLLLLLPLLLLLLLILLLLLFWSLWMVAIVWSSHDAMGPLHSGKGLKEISGALGSIRREGEGEGTTTTTTSLSDAEGGTGEAAQRLGGDRA